MILCLRKLGLVLGFACGLGRLSEHGFSQARHGLPKGFAGLALFEIGIDDFFNGIRHFIFSERAANDGAQCGGRAKARMTAKQGLVESRRGFIGTLKPQMARMVMSPVFF